MKIKLLLLALLASSFTFGQLYTPSGTIAGSISNGATGNIGIGITDPQSKLTVFNNGLPGSNQLELRTAHARNPERYFMKNTIYGSGKEDVTFSLRHDGRMFVGGNVRIGLNDNNSDTPADLRVYNNQEALVEISNSSGRFQIARAGCNGCYGALIGDAVLRNLGQSNNMIFSLPNDNNDGNSYIGIQDGSRGTWVKFLNNGVARFDGKIYAKEVEIKANVWADYVFKKGYKLKPLEEVEKYIEEKGHLPNIPSAEEVSRDGINLAEMNTKLLEKIEELTLYSIEQNKQIKLQDKKIEKFEQQIQELLSASKNN
ncbi:nitrogenase component 1 family protein [Chryseobacterium fistulae]|uniref:Cell wall anchor protein n=1 Tax=Chryseobacterium fistulae TaxID=2675058 RepID=A0A6N4XXL9_9FLAO|nr:cell wall anchor protein [Chryseobacterium fistulae]CAA7389971.1 hypothetical protein CHRY9393_02267 [Chryseobacterium fistulae]